MKCASIIVLSPVIVSAQQWHAGTWDSTVYNRAEHPKTVAVRIDVRDVDTGLPVEGAQVDLKGQYTQDTIGPGHFDGRPQNGPQLREFRMSAQTGPDGVAVFALGWKKLYPWDTGRPENYDVHTSWARAIDDIEKVQTIEIRSSRYRESVMNFDFSSIVNVGQDPSTERQNPSVVQAFETAWHAEAKKENVRFCILNLGTTFNGFKNTGSSREEFFESIRKRDLGTVMSEPQNYFSFGDYPQSECGPYFVCEVQTRLQKVAAQVEVVPQTASDNDRRADHASPQTSGSDASLLGADRRERIWVTNPEGKALSLPRPDKPGTAPDQNTKAVGQKAQTTADAIGLVVETLSDQKRRELGLFVGVQGALITYVLPDSKADRAGLVPGLVIESVDQRLVDKAEDYQAAIGTKKAGDQFDLGVWERRGKNWSRGRRRVSL